MQTDLVARTCCRHKNDKSSFVSISLRFSHQLNNNKISKVDLVIGRLVQKELLNKQRKGDQKQKGRRRKKKEERRKKKEERRKKKEERRKRKKKEKEEKKKRW